MYISSFLILERESHFVFHGAKNRKHKLQTEPYFGAKRTTKPVLLKKLRSQMQDSTLTGDGNTQTQIDNDDMDTSKLDDNDCEDIETVTD